MYVQFSSVARSCLTLCDPMDCSMPGLPVLNRSLSLLKLMSTESMMLSKHLIPCCPLCLLPSTFPSIRVFSNESAVYISWPKYWSFSISPSNGCLCFLIYYLDSVENTYMLISSKRKQKYISCGQIPCVIYS